MPVINSELVNIIQSGTLDINEKLQKNVCSEYKGIPVVNYHDIAGIFIDRTREPLIKLSEAKAAYRCCIDDRCKALEVDGYSAHDLVELPHAGDGILQFYTDPIQYQKTLQKEADQCKKRGWKMYVCPHGGSEFGCSCGAVGLALEKFHITGKTADEMASEFSDKTTKIFQDLGVTSTKFFCNQKENYITNICDKAGLCQTGHLGTGYFVASRDMHEDREYYIHGQLLEEKIGMNMYNVASIEDGILATKVQKSAHSLGMYQNPVILIDGTDLKNLDGQIEIARAIEKELEEYSPSIYILGVEKIKGARLTKRTIIFNAAKDLMDSTVPTFTLPTIKFPKFSKPTIFLR